MKRWKDLLFMAPVVAGAILAVLLIPMGPASPKVADHDSEATESEWIQPPPAKKLYGIPVSSYQITSGKLRWGESLAELLYRFGVNIQTSIRHFPTARFPD